MEPQKLGWCVQALQELVLDIVSIRSHHHNHPELGRRKEQKLEGIQNGHPSSTQDSPLGSLELFQGNVELKDL